MKFYSLQTFIILILATIAFSSPIDTDAVESKNETDNKLTKRFDVGTYLSSIGNFLTGSNIARNVFYTDEKTLDIYYDKKDNQGKKPVVMYIYGGTWYMGEKALYSKLGDFLRDSGFVGVIPNYVQFPWGTIDEMLIDINNSVRWVAKNIEKYGGDSQNIILLGHSSGAHLAALTLIKTTLGLNYGFANGGSYPQLPQIQRVVLLNGVYDFDLFSDVYKNKGQKPENGKFERFATYILGLENPILACPTDILKQYPDKSIQSLGVNRIVVVHSDEDKTVPYDSSKSLYEEILRTSNVPVVPYMVEGYYHCGITEGIMNKDTKAQSIVYDLLTKV